MTNKGRHCPAHIIIGRAIQWNMPSGVARLLYNTLIVSIFSQVTGPDCVTG
ncbi:hypothetical protein [Candidatus Spongiihabitans sp.]|uniref:hypothetical protein n=1 Tax=Candidatus Spongiihabitans sp. TaxID=3101308 RepID=UPI003C7B29D4